MANQHTIVGTQAESPTRERPSATQSLRRLYTYAVAGATLTIAAIGAVNLLGLGLDALLTAITGEGWKQGEPNWERERLSLSIPFIVIALPIWYLHWRMAQRAVHGDDADAERRSVIRNLFFTLLFLASASIIVPQLTSTIDLTLTELLGGSLLDYERDSVVSGLATVIVTAAIWVFHLRAYTDDVQNETTEVRPLVLPQVAIYLVSAVGAFLLLFSLSDLLRLAIDALADVDRIDRWWRNPLANSAALAISGGLVWGAHWYLARRETTESSWWGEGERGAGVRRVYLVAMAIIAGFMALFFLAESIDGLANLAINVSERPGETRLTAIAGPLVATLPFVGLWLLHRRWLHDEPSAAGYGIQPITVERIFGYAMAFLGLLLASTGAAMLLGEGIQKIASDDNWRQDIGWPLGLLIGGGAVWGWYWRETQRRLERNPNPEQASTSRRAFLFIVLGSSIVALVVGLAMTIYQVMQEVLGISESARLASEISLPLGITIVTVAVVAWHGVLLRRDMAVREEIERQEASLAVEAGVSLTLTGPKGGDVDTVIETLRRHLPAGYRLTR